ncbi:hypothetical protein [Falsiroseomonas sp.]|uniref:hypothetical protein n=1 Tax=Falsiroseomonas sp. TaxID=2870721 RepID=UPI003F71AC3E
MAVGTCLTHAAGILHGPHESRDGARLLTVQSWQSHHGDFDFEPAENAPADPSQGSEGRTQPVDQAAQEAARREAAEPEHRGYS